MHCLQLIAFGQGWKHIRKGWTLLQWLTICFDLSKDGAISDYCSSTLKPTETELVALLSLSATGTKCFCVCGLSFGVEHSALERATLERPAKTNEQLMSPQLRRRCCVGIQSSGCKCGGGAVLAAIVSLRKQACKWGGMPVLACLQAAVSAVDSAGNSWKDLPADTSTGIALLNEAFCSEPSETPKICKHCSGCPISLSEAF